MIVSCPTCSTHYSHTAESALEIGRCSQCDARFPLSGQKRRYIVMPAARSGSPDPLLAAGLAETQTQVDRQATSPESIGIDMPALPEGIPPESPDPGDDGLFGASTKDDEPLFGIDEIDPSTEAETKPGPDTAVTKPAKRRPSHSIREALGVFLLAGLGGAAGFHGSLQFDFEPLKAVAAGLAVGLTLGWAWIRWAERKR